MLLGVAVVATSIIISALIAVVIGSAYEATVDRRRSVELPPSVLAVVVMSIVAGCLLEPALG